MQERIIIIESLQEQKGRNINRSRIRANLFIIKILISIIEINHPDMFLKRVNRYYPKYCKNIQS